MLRLLLLAVVPALPLFLLVAACAPADVPPAELLPTREASDILPPPFALVELFTSEGCSSCPPADELLGALAGRGGVVALSFHVDYWNGLGWRDPYSDAAFSARQRAYALRIPGGVYTPQMVVNGTAAFVGSRRREAEARVGAALAQAASSALTLAAQPEAGGIAVAYAVAGAPAGAVVHVALAERAAEQEVARGENRGRRLRHTNVVRAFRTVEAAAGRLLLPLPEGLAPDAVRVAAWVQEGATGPVLGAAWAETSD